MHFKTSVKMIFAVFFIFPVVHQTLALMASKIQFVRLKVQPRNLSFLPKPMRKTKVNYSSFILLTHPPKAEDNNEEDDDGTLEKRRRSLEI